MWKWLLDKIIKRRENICTFTLNIVGIGTSRMEISADITFYKVVSRYDGETTAYGSYVSIHPPVNGSNLYGWGGLDQSITDTIDDIVMASVDKTLEKLTEGEMTEEQLIEETKNDLVIDYNCRQDATNPEPSTGG